MSRKGLNIYKRKDGRWEARYIKSRNALGKPKYGYLYASSYREVRCDLQHTLQLQGKPSGSEERTRNSTFELVSIEKLLQNAETNGVDFNTIDAKIKTNSDGTCTLTVQINDFLKDESGQSASVSVKVDAKDNAKTVTQKVAEKAADSAASKVVEKSGLTGEAAGIANSMAQEALRKGLGSAGSGQGTESSGTVTAPTYDPSQDSGESDDFDWSQIQSEFDSLKDEFPS